MTRTPASLLERLRQPHDGEAWGQLVHLFTPLLLRWVRRLGLQEADGADMVQEVFAILVRQLPTFQYKASGSFRAWLYTIFHHCWYAKQRHRQPSLLTADQMDAMAAPPPPQPGQDIEEQRLLLHRALTLVEQEQSPITWRAFYQTAIENRQGKDVAAALGLTVNAVYIARARVLKRLREKLMGLLE